MGWVNEGKRVNIPNSIVRGAEKWKTERIRKTKKILEAYRAESYDRFGPPHKFEILNLEFKPFAVTNELMELPKKRFLGGATGSKKQHLMISFV